MPPVVSAQRIATRPGAEVYIQLGFTDDDGPGPYAYTIVRGPRHGALTGDNNDRTYTPAAGFTGKDEFTWKVNDGVADSPVATVTIDVRASDRERIGKARTADAPGLTALPPHTVAIGSGGADGSLAVGPNGAIHVIYGGKRASRR